VTSDFHQTHIITNDWVSHFIQHRPAKNLKKYFDTNLPAVMLLDLRNFKKILSFCESLEERYLVSQRIMRIRYLYNINYTI